MLGKIVLGFSALLFIGFGLLGLFSPSVPAEMAGLEILNGDAHAEIAAMYGGLQTSVGLFCVLALVRAEYNKAALVLLAMVMGAVGLARLATAMTSPGEITSYTHIALGFEFVVTTLAIAALAGKSNDPA